MPELTFRLLWQECEKDGRVSNFGELDKILFGFGITMTVAFLYLDEKELSLKMELAILAIATKHFLGSTFRTLKLCWV